ncbi:hypothetical protein L873DRAFT_1823743, partial [Choiromyces venosus 120613-1]
YFFLALGCVFSCLSARLILSRGPVVLENSQAAPVTCPNPENKLAKKQKSWQLSPSYNRGSAT